VIRNLKKKGTFPVVHKLHLLPMIASLALSATLFATTSPAFAAPSGPDYRLTSEKSLSGNLVAGETLWRCATDGCTAATATSRPAIVCAQAARTVGKLSSFSFRGADFDAEALAKCNVKAR
jgi:hypothetical protein